MNPQKIFLISLGLSYTLAVVNCVHILRAKRSPAASISWIWANIAIPFAGVLLYWFFGFGRIRGYKRSMPRHKAELSSNEGAVLESSHLSHYSRIFSHFGSIFQPKTAELTLLLNGKATFEAIFLAIDQAKDYIFVQYYILRSDRLGFELQRLLIKKASEGVKIYLLYDDMGSFWLSRKYLAALKKAGVKTASFLPVFSAKKFYLMNFRNHRKLVVVDGHVAFTGGLNVGDEYLTIKPGKGRGNWRDTHLEIQGEGVSALASIFCWDWYYTTGEQLACVMKDVSGRQSAKGDRLKQLVQIIPSGPYDDGAMGMLLFLQMVHGAKKRLWVSTPYFVPDEALLRSLELAVLKGVDVRILLPQVSDELLVHWVSLSYADQMNRKGVKIFLYQKGFNHQKVMIVDDDLSFVGTSNFDNRTMYLNFETMVVIHGHEFNFKLATMFSEDFRASSFYHFRDRKRFGQILGMRANIARLLAPLL